MSRPRVLIVDDDTALLEITSAACEALGYPALTASSAPEALAVLSENPSLELAIVDVTLGPDGDGFELGDDLAVKRKDLAIVYLSGFGDQVDRPARHSDATVHRKPLPLADLRALLGATLS